MPTTYCTADDVRTYSNHPALKEEGLDVTIEAVKARAVILFGDPTEGDTITVDGSTFTFSAVPGSNKFADIDELTDLIQALTNVNASNNGLTVTVVAAVAGDDGNAIALSKTGTALTLSGATLSGGMDEDSANDDTTLEAKIIAAEIVIDAAVKYVQKLDPAQARKFPRSDDTDGSIPEAIKFAMIYQVEFMYVNSPDVDHGVEPDVSPTTVSISPRSLKLLRAGYIKNTGEITLPPTVDPRAVQIGGSAYNGDIHFQQEQ